MGLQLLLKQELLDTGQRGTLWLHGAAPPGTVTAVGVDIYWRREDAPTDEPQFLASGVAGSTIKVPFTVETTIRFFMRPRASFARRGGTVSWADCAQTTFGVSTRPAGVDGVTATEALTAGNSGFVNLYNSSGLKVRKANATDNTKPCDGYILDNIANAATGTVYKTRGDVIPGLSGLTVGAIYWLSTTGGQITTTPDRSASGRIIQIIGQAMSATELLFDPQPPITVA